MSSHPISVRNKSSKFTLTKKEFNDNLNKFGGNILANKIINEINNNQSDFFHFKKTVLKKNIKNNHIQSSNRFRGKINNQTIDKSKKNLNNLNTDFLKLFREMNLLKKSKNSNKTAIEISLQEKSKLKSMYNPSVSHSKSKGKNNSKTNKNNNNIKKPKKQNSKSKNLKINSNYEPLHTDEKNNILNNTQRNIIFNSNYKKKSYNINKKNNKLPKKTFKTFNPFTIKFAKPINGQIKNKMKQSNITTYHINFSKIIPNKLNNSLHHNINKTQEIIHNTSKTKQKQDYKKSINERNNSNNNLNKNNNIKNNFNNIKNKTKTKSNSNNNNNISNNINNISKNEKSETQINKEKEKEKVREIKNIKEYINDFFDDKNISNIDDFEEKVNMSNNDDIDDDESDNSGVLAYDEVRDIIVYYDMGDLNKKQGYLFDKGDYKNFLNTKKETYLNFFLNNNNNNENNRVLKIENKKKTPPTNESSKNKKNFINIIKN